ncbi:MAG: hypothetical protein R2824_03845 [Saprospiraceae bacterium]|nr:hypothetical protein [Lewinella sp.]
MYRSELGRVVTTRGIIREIFRKAESEFAILENGLPIPTQNLLYIARMEG